MSTNNTENTVSLKLPIFMADTVTANKTLIPKEVLKKAILHNTDSIQLINRETGEVLGNFTSICFEDDTAIITYKCDTEKVKELIQNDIQVACSIQGPTRRDEV
jgi:hypothetical protein